MRSATAGSETHQTALPQQVFVLQQGFAAAPPAPVWLALPAGPPPLPGGPTGQGQLSQGGGSAGSPGQVRLPGQGFVRVSCSLPSKAMIVASAVNRVGFAKWGWVWNVVIGSPASFDM